nr:MAG TPA: hypothetical protein [Caudoviricetes sp.]
MITAVSFFFKYIFSLSHKAIRQKRSAAHGTFIKSM